MRFGSFGGRRHKHNACRTVTSDGVSFPSRLEARRWSQLLLLQQAGEISDLKRQPRVELTRAKIVDHPDFVYTECDRQVFEETKGFETADYLIKKKLWRVYGPGVLRVMKAAGGQSVRMAEEIIPECRPDG